MVFFATALDSCLFADQHKRMSLKDSKFEEQSFNKGLTNYQYCEMIIVIEKIRDLQVKYIYT